ncbi:Conserved_hypothetical protein [Hexamita inflata]|uniref:Myb-like domain-containing protein n=1 Tax=Hexamita inflata TaxID=28002 RepID=A0ABP1JRT3_9EUKA
MSRMYSKWNEEEISLLQEALNETDPNIRYKWVHISKIIKTKTPRQCYDQYLFISKKNGHQGKNTVIKEQTADEQTSHMADSAIVQNTPLNNTQNNNEVQSKADILDLLQKLKDYI